MDKAQRKAYAHEYYVKHKARLQATYSSPYNEVKGARGPREKKGKPLPYIPEGFSAVGTEVDHGSDHAHEFAYHKVAKDRRYID